MAASAAYAEAVLNSGDDDAETLVTLTRAAEREQMAALIETRAISADDIAKTEAYGRLMAVKTWPGLCAWLLSGIGRDAATLARLA